MARLAPPISPLERSPVFRFSGRTTVWPKDRSTGVEVVYADGRVAERAEFPSFSRWTCLRLRVVLERYAFEKAPERSVRKPGALAAVRLAARAFAWKHVLDGTGSLRLGPVAANPKPFSKKAFDKALLRIVFAPFSNFCPRMLFRTGGPMDVQYEAALEITPYGFEIDAHDTKKNRAALERLFDALRGQREVVFMTLGHARAGHWSEKSLRNPKNHSMGTNEEKYEAANLAGPYRAHVGTTWMSEPVGEERARKWAAAQRGAARIDAEGLVVKLPAPKSATDRRAPLTAMRKAFETLRRTLARDAYDAAHAPKRKPKEAAKKSPAKTSARKKKGP